MLQPFRVQRWGSFIMDNFVDIPGYEGLYKININGVILSSRKSRTPIHKVKDKILKQCINSHGYFIVSLSKNGSRKMKSVHRLIAECFIPNNLNLPCINHKNGIKTDNRIDNLEWCTYSENIKHAIRTGLLIVKRKSFIQLNCLFCGNIFTKNKVSKKIFCSRRCSAAITKPHLHFKDKHKLISQFNINGRLIRNWESVNSASKFLNIPQSTISINLTGRSKTCRGFIFKYVNNGYQ